ncbi:MAG: hypothetical protein BroJett040_24640 [Oligoflexia bacterium]|nr:MAG: hypothetical protein BroJett040_24640 [Oligoflexia bacterium]
MNNQNPAPNQKDQAQSSFSSKGSDLTFVSSTQLSYHEMDVVPVRQTDVLEQLEKNIETLSDIRYRMQFMMREVRYLMKI